jgi:hypothetical protein
VRTGGDRRYGQRCSIPEGDARITEIEEEAGMLVRKLVPDTYAAARVKQRIAGQLLAEG